MNPKFKLGQCVSTIGAADALNESGEMAFRFLARHACGDWGDLDEEDRQSNEAGLSEDDPARLMSEYHTSKGVRLWVITEWDRSVTTILLPEEY